MAGPSPSLSLFPRGSLCSLSRSHAHPPSTPLSLHSASATCIIQPIDMVKVRLQLGAKGGPVSSRGIEGARQGVVAAPVSSAARARREEGRAAGAPAYFSEVCSARRTHGCVMRDLGSAWGVVVRRALRRFDRQAACIPPPARLRRAAAVRRRRGKARAPSLPGRPPVGGDPTVPERG